MNHASVIGFYLLNDTKKLVQEREEEEGSISDDHERREFETFAGVR